MFVGCMCSESHVREKIEKGLERNGLSELCKIGDVIWE